MASWERIALRAEERVDELRKENEHLQAEVKKANEFILDVAEQLGMDTDGIGYDGLQLSIEDFKDKHLQAEVDRLRDGLLEFKESFLEHGFEESAKNIDELLNTKK